MREFKVMASSFSGTYTAGRHQAETAEEACAMARRHYARTGLGATLHDAGAFRFYVVDAFPHEEEDAAG